MNYANIKFTDISNGIGVRTSLFVSGCTHHCPGCFNPETWDFCYGKEYTKETEDKIIESLKPPYVAGLSLLGGEPFEPENSETLAKLCERVKKELPGKTIWCYSGYSFDSDMMEGKLSKVSSTRKLLENIDVLVDGEFVLELKDISLKFRGSSNQRIINVPASLKESSVVLIPELN